MGSLGGNGLDNLQEKSDVSTIGVASFEDHDMFFASDITHAAKACALTRKAQLMSTITSSKKEHMKKRGCVSHNTLLYLRLVQPAGGTLLLTLRERAGIIMLT